MLSVEIAVLNLRAVFDCICVFSSSGAEKVSSIRSNTICSISVYLESVEEYSEGKIQLLRLNITSQCDNI